MTRLRMRRAFIALTLAGASAINRVRFQVPRVHRSRLEETFHVKCIFRYLPLLLCIPFANAQSSFDLNVGFGANFDSTSGQGIDNANSTNAFGSSTPGSSDAYRSE